MDCFGCLIACTGRGPRLLELSRMSGYLASSLELCLGLVLAGSSIHCSPSAVSPDAVLTKLIVAALLELLEVIVVSLGVIVVALLELSGGTTGTTRSNSSITRSNCSSTTRTI